MNYGKNQQALLKFLEKYPNKWHRIKRRKAINAAIRLVKRLEGMMLVKVTDFKNGIYVSLYMPQMLIKQN